jgi:hypothetical protein
LGGLAEFARKEKPEDVQVVIIVERGKGFNFSRYLFKRYWARRLRFRQRRLERCPGFAMRG